MSGNRILKDLFHGNLAPADQQMIPGSEAARAVAELSKAEKLLVQSLPPELQPIMDSVMKAQGKVDVVMAETNYVNGFKNGARLMMEILDNAHENLRSLTEQQEEATP